MAKGKGYQRIQARGQTFNRRTHQALTLAEHRLGYKLTAYQGSYEKSGASASAGTHDGGGAVDLAPYDYKRKVLVLRRIGFAAWYRPALPGVWTAHIHAILKGDKELPALARQQLVAYANGRNGLANNGPDNGPDVRPLPTYRYKPNGLDLKGKGGHGGDHISKDRHADTDELDLPNEPEASDETTRGTH